MKNLIKTVKLNLADSERKLSLRYLPLKTTSIDVKSTLKRSQNGCLVERKHHFLQTQFDLIETEPCWLLVFDEQKLFVTAIPCLNKSKTPLSFFIADPYVVLITPDNELPLDNIKSMEIIDNQKH